MPPRNNKLPLAQKKKILENFVESRYVDIFIAFLNDTWGWGSIACSVYEGKKEKLRSYEEFSEDINREIEFIIGSKHSVKRSNNHKNSVGKATPFRLYYHQDDELNLLTRKNYQKVLKTHGIVIMATEDKENAYRLYKIHQEQQTT